MTKVLEPLKSEQFRVIYNLDGMNETEIESYKRAAAVYFGLNPDTNPFDVVWMNDDGSGMKRRQLYARRGTTDILREERGISITDLIQHDGPGYVSFTAKGVNKLGRQEIAVGAHSTAGLSGERLAAAVATAETRAGRRLTLKFVGLGILDHSEVTDPTDIKAAAPNLELSGSAAVIPPMPSFPISPTVSAFVPKPVENVVVQNLAEAADIARRAQEQLGTGRVNEPVAAVLNETPEQFSARMIQLRADATAQLTAKQPVVQDVHPEISASEAEAKNGHSLTEPAPKRTRRRKNTVDISAPGQISAPVETAQKIETVVPSPVVESKMILAPLPAGIPDTPENRARLAAWVGESAKAVVPTQANSAVPVQANPVPAPQPTPIQTSPFKEVAQASAVPWQAPQSAPQPHQPVLAPPTPAPAIDFPGKPTKEQEEKYRAVFREYSNQTLPVDGGMKPSAGIGGPSAKLRVFFEHYVGKSTQQATAQEWEDFIAWMAEFSQRNSVKGLVKYINDSIGAK